MINKLRSMFCGTCLDRSEVHETIRKVFGPELLMRDNVDTGSQRRKYIRHVKDNLSKVLDTKLLQLTSKHKSSKRNSAIVIGDDRPGRIGPTTVVFDAAAGTGRMILVGDERVSVQGLSNFATIRATVCVFSGKWMYEAQLGTEGVMQMGWCSHGCLFSLDAGVGDTPHSYAYDGGRVRSWNIATSKYGQHWRIGDVIGSCIDMDNGTIEYYRNGVSMGVAFESIHRGKGVAYFPAVSLAVHENLSANFGHMPFVFPVDGYSPLQAIPLRDCARAALLLNSLDVLINETLALEDTDGTGSVETKVSALVKPPSGNDSDMSSKAFLTSLAHILIAELSSSVRVSYVVVAEVLPRLRAMLGLPTHSSTITPDNRATGYYNARKNEGFKDLSESFRKTPHRSLCRLMDWLWSFMDEVLVCDVLEYCVVRQSTLYDMVSQDMSFSQQLESVYFLCALLQHSETRRHLVKYVLFGRIMFDSFLQMKRPDDAVLRTLVRRAWWNRPTSVQGEADPRIADSELQRSDQQQRQSALDVNHNNTLSWKFKGSKLKHSYNSMSECDLEQQYREDCDKITAAIAPLEQIQVEFLLMMLDNTDGSDIVPSARKIFLEKFRRYILDNCILDMRLFSISHNTPSICWFCHARLLSVVLKLWDEHPLQDPWSPPHLPPRAFIDGSLDFYNVDRLGGVLPYLVRTLRQELVGVLGENNAFVQSFEPRYNVGGGIDTGVNGAMNDDNSSPALTTLPQVISSIARFMNATTMSTPINRPGVETQLPMKGERSVMPGAGCAEPRTTMLLLIDGMTAMYHGSAVKHAEKLSEFRDQQSDLADCLYDVEQRLASVTGDLHMAVMNSVLEEKDLTENEKRKKAYMESIIKELQRTKEVYEEKLSSGSLQLAWTAGAVWTRERQSDLARIFAGSLHTLRLASDKQYAAQAQVRSREVLPEKSSLLHEETGPNSYASLELRYDSASNQSPDSTVRESRTATPQSTSQQHPLVGHPSRSDNYFPTELFPFVPDYYLETALELCNTLRLFMPPTVPTNHIPDWEELLVRCASLLCMEIADTRVVLASARDSLVQTLASFATEPRTMRALERVPTNAQNILIEELIRPYKGRSWAQSNWVLVRFWHGSGFGYRHRQWPHLAVKFGDREPTVSNLGAKVDAALMSQCFGPCPSELMQSRIGEYMAANPDKTNDFFHSLLNQLHWAFSEFVNLMQEIERANWHSSVDSRQTKLCATCFDLYHSLCRALEMALHLAPTALTRHTAVTSELLLTRTSQMLLSVVSRVCSRVGGGAAFAEMSSRGLPDMDRVHYYVALAPIAGCLIELLRPEHSPEHLIKVSRALVMEPLFKLPDLEFMLGRHNDNAFSFYNYPDDVTATELAALESVVERLRVAGDAMRPQSTTSSLSRSDLLCTICYARVADTVFLPCNHHSCRSCIDQHLLNSKQCFFCKADIESVAEMEPVQQITTS